MPLSSDDLVELHAGAYTATVAPAAGGRVASLSWHSGATQCPLLVGWDGRPFDEHHWPKAGAFPMLPFANRLPRDGFRFRGRRRATAARTRRFCSPRLRPQKTLDRNRL